MKILVLTGDEGPDCQCETIVCSDEIVYATQLWRMGKFVTDLGLKGGTRLYVMETPMNIRKLMGEW